jgi:hypothetical protein
MTEAEYEKQLTELVATHKYDPLGYVLVALVDPTRPRTQI